MKLHLDGCPYNEPQAWRYEHGASDTPSLNCTCPPEHLAKVWKGQWMLLRGSLEEIIVSTSLEQAQAIARRAL